MPWLLLSLPSTNFENEGMVGGFFVVVVVVVVRRARARETAVRALSVPEAKCTLRTAVEFAAGKLRVFW